MVTLSSGRVVSAEEWDRLRAESNKRWGEFYAGLEARFERCGNCRFWQENPGYRLGIETARLQGNLVVYPAGTVTAPSKDEGWCRQFPSELKASHLDWCGQFEARRIGTEQEEAGE